MNLVESITPVGTLVVKKIYLDGREEIHQEVKNLIVNAGKTILAKLLGGDVAYKNLEHITKMAFGTDNTAAAAGDAALGAEEFEGATVNTYPAYNQVLFSTTMGAAEGGSFTYEELGLKTDATEILFSRVIINPITKSALYKIQVDWTISFQ